MAGYRGHMVGAATFFGMYIAVLFALVALGIAVASVAQLRSWELLGAMLAVTVLFGLWPDVDTNSKGQDMFYGAIFALDVALILFGYLELAAYLGLLGMLPILGKHRGWTHSFWAMLVVPLPILLIPYIYHQQNLQVAFLFYCAAVVGYFSHLFFDGRVLRLIKPHNH